MIIAYTGQAGAGKSTFAKATIAAIAAIGAGASPFSFAESLKDRAEDIWRPTAGSWAEVATAFRGTQAEKETQRAWLGGRTGREFLQEFGALARSYNEEVWLNFLREQVAFFGADEIVVIDDCRYPNEAVLVRDLGGVVIELVNTSQPLTRLYLNTHESEQGVGAANIDFTVSHDGASGADRHVADVIRRLGL